MPVSRAGLPGSGVVRSIIVNDLQAMAEAARVADAPLAVQSAYRSAERQRQVFAGWVAVYGPALAARFSARPGHSEHQLGTALDLGVEGGPPPCQHQFAQTRQGRWIAAHAWQFGLVVSYPPGSEALACYIAEAWHVRYVGRQEARAIDESGLTLREWLWRHVE